MGIRILGKNSFATACFRISHLALSGIGCIQEYKNSNGGNSRVASTEIFLRQKWRFAAFGLNVCIFYCFYIWANGGWRLTGGGETLWFLSAVGWWSLGLISAPWYRPPRDALASGVAVLTALFTLDTSTILNLRPEMETARDVVLVYATFVSLLAAIAAFLKHGETMTISEALHSVLPVLWREAKSYSARPHS